MSFDPDRLYRRDFMDNMMWEAIPTIMRLPHKYARFETHNAYQGQEIYHVYNLTDLYTAKKIRARLLHQLNDNYNGYWMPKGVWNFI